MATKKDIQNQKELNALQRLTMSMAKDMSKAMEEVAKQSDKRNKLLQKDANLTKKILNDLEKTGDAEKAINKIKGQENEVSKKNYGVNQKQAQIYKAQLIAIRGISEGQKNAAIALQGVFDVTDEVASKFGGLLEKTDNFIKKIPIIGPALSNAFKPIKEKGELAITRAAAGMKNGLIRQFTRAKAAGDDFATSLGKGLKGGFAGAEKAIAGTLNISIMSFRLLAIAALGVVAIIGTIILVAKLMAAAFKMGMERFKEIDAAAKSFRNETGLLNSQTNTLVGNIQTISADMANLGVSAEDVSKAASDFSNEFQGLEQPSEAVLSSMVMLNKNFGIGTTEASKLNKVFQNIGGLTAEQSQALIGQTVSMAKIAGVAPSQVIDDMAKSSEVAYRYFQGSPQELAKAAVAAAKLGTSIEEAGKVADGLLDFQSSISSELKAQAMLGTNLNFAQARYLAANGDILGSQQAIIDQVQKNVDLTNLNTYEQQALAEATGMEFSSLQNQVRIRERFGKLNKEQLAAANALVDAGRDISQLTESDLKAQTERMGRQQEMQSMFDELGNTVNSVKVAFTDMFAPIASTVMPIFVSLVKLVGGALATAFRGIASVISFILTPVQLIADGFKTAFDMINNSINALKVFVGTFGILLAYKERGLIIDKVTIGLQKAKTVAETVYGAAVKAANLIKKKGLLSAIAEMAMRAFSSLSAIPIVGPVLGIAGAAAAAALGYSYFSKAGDIRSEARGKTQVSTKEGALYELSGNDDFAAGPGILDAIDTQGSPQVALSGAGNVDLSPILGGLQELGSRLEMAFSQNKDVYMDNTKVTAKVTTTQDKSGRTNSFGINKG